MDIDYQFPCDECGKMLPESKMMCLPNVKTDSDDATYRYCQQCEDDFTPLMMSMPVLQRIWDNPKDAAYDKSGE